MTKLSHKVLKSAGTFLLPGLALAAIVALAACTVRTPTTEPPPKHPIVRCCSSDGPLWNRHGEKLDNRNDSHFSVTACFSSERAGELRRFDSRVSAKPARPEFRGWILCAGARWSVQLFFKMLNSLDFGGQSRLSLAKLLTCPKA